MVVDVQHEAARFLVRFSLVTSPLTRASQFELRLGLYREVMEELSPPDHMPPNCRAHDAFTVRGCLCTWRSKQACAPRWSDVHRWRGCRERQALAY